MKVLPPELMAGASAERFHLEMRHAAQLQHPHIVPVLSAGLLEPGSAAVPYYIMPLIQGETLRARIEREGALPPPEVRRILVDVVDAVGYAHAAGITHRDLKPDNIFLVGQSALVSDFGVSEALVAGDSLQTSGLGVVLGTPSYLSPEQAAGSRFPDPRSDLYAIGVTAYEALTGQRPFAADTIHDLLVAQASQPVPSLAEARPDIPAELAATVMRCLEKRPEDRFPDAAALRSALEYSGTASRPAGRIGVKRPSWPLRLLILAALVLGVGLLALAWHHLIPGPDQRTDHLPSVALIAPDYFRPDAPSNPAVVQVVDRVSTMLSRSEGLKVINYMSVGALFRRSQTPTFSEVGQALGVEHLVVFAPVGDVRRGQVAVQLVEVPTQAQVWVTQYAADSASLETIETDIVSRVTHALLGPSARLPVQAHAERARREGAHAEYLAGMLALRRRTPDGVAEAIGDFEQALLLDSTHVESLGRLATALGLQLSYGYRTTMASYPTSARALILAERAMALDPTHGEPVGFLAYIEYLTLAPIGQVRVHFNQAIRMRAAEADVAGWNALLLLREGKTEQSLSESQRALELDPNSSARHLTLALAALGARRYPLAALEARRARETEPDLRRPRQVEALALLMQNRGPECAALDLWPHMGVRAMCLRAAGREVESRRLVDSLVAMVNGDGDLNDPYSDVLPAQELATFYGWRGDAQLCLRYLRLAFDRSPVGIDLRIVQSGIYDPVRDAPNFSSELIRILEAVWPRVQQSKRLLQKTQGLAPVI